MEGARGDEQDVIGLDRAVLRRDRGALDQRQQIALHPLAADIGAGVAAAARDSGPAAKVRLDQSIIIGPLHLGQSRKAAIKGDEINGFQQGCPHYKKCRIFSRAFALLFRGAVDEILRLPFRVVQA